MVAKPKSSIYYSQNPRSNADLEWWTENLDSSRDGKVLFSIIILHTIQYPFLETYLILQYRTILLTTFQSISHASRILPNYLCLSLSLLNHSSLDVLLPLSPSNQASQIFTPFPKHQNLHPRNFPHSLPLSSHSLATSSMHLIGFPQWIDDHKKRIK